MNTVYLIGHEASSWPLPPLGWDTTVGRFNALYSRCAAVTLWNEPVTASLLSVIPDNTGYYARFTFYLVNGYNAAFFSDTLFSLKTTGGYVSASVMSGDGGVFVRLFNYHTNTYVDGGLYTPTVESLVECQLRVYALNGNSTAELRIEGQAGVVSSATVSGGFNGASAAYFGGTGVGGTLNNYYYTVYWSDVAITSFDLSGHHVFLRHPTGPGTYSETAGGAGEYLNLDEVTPDASYARFTADGQRLTITVPALPSPLFSIKAVALLSRAASDGLRVLKPLLRKDGVDVEGAVLASDPALAPRAAVYVLDPVTGQVWTGDLSGVEYGFKREAS